MRFRLMFAAITASLAWLACSACPGNESPPQPPVEKRPPPITAESRAQRCTKMLHRHVEGFARLVHRLGLTDHPRLVAEMYQREGSAVVSACTRQRILSYFCITRLLEPHKSWYKCRLRVNFLPSFGVEMPPIWSRQLTSRPPTLDGDAVVKREAQLVGRWSCGELNLSLDSKILPVEVRIARRASALRVTFGARQPLSRRPQRTCAVRPDHTLEMVTNDVVKVRPYTQLSDNELVIDWSKAQLDLGWVKRRHRFFLKLDAYSWLWLRNKECTIIDFDAALERPATCTWDTHSALDNEPVLTIKSGGLGLHRKQRQYVFRGGWLIKLRAYRTRCKRLPAK